MNLRAALSAVALVGACLAAGWCAGPLVRLSQAHFFPQPEYVEGDFGDLYRQSNREVVLFSTSSCPFCELTRELLERNPIPHTDYVIDRSKNATRLFESVGAGNVPQLFVGNRRITGFHEQAIVEALRIKGYPVDAAHGGAANAGGSKRKAGAM
jgi:glutaredoxin